MAAEVVSPLFGREVGFVDREKELSILRNLHNKAVEGKGQVLFVTGEAGVGKTRLAMEFGQHAHASGSVFASGTSYQQELTSPYTPWVDVLRSVINETAREVLAKIPGIWAAEISRLVPELATQAKELGIKGWILGRETSSFITSTTDQERVRLFQAVTDFLKTASQQRPLIIFLDDLLWADTASLQLFHYVARRISGQRIMLVATYRDVELEENHPLNRLILDLNRERLLNEITLSRFTIDFVAKLISNNLGGGEVSKELAELIYDKTGGNPFFAEEVLRSLVEQRAVFKGDAGWAVKDAVSVQIPRSVRAAIRRRIAHLRDECAQTLSIASVIGMQSSFNLLMKTVGYDEDRLIELMESALKAGLVEEEQIGNEVVYVFADEQIRDFLYEEISLIRRRKFHLKVGQAIEELGQDYIKRHVDELAYHYIQGGDIVKAADYSEKAGDDAAKIYAHQEAIKHYNNALELLEETQPEKRLEIFAKSAYASSNLGDLRKVESFCRGGIEHAENLGDVRRNAEMHALLGRLIWALQNDKLGALKVLEEGLEIIEELEDTVEKAAICENIGRIYAFTGEQQHAIQWCQRAIDIAKKSGANEVLAHAYQSLSYCLPLERKKEILTYLEESLRISLENGLEEPACRVHANLGGFYSILKGDYRKAEDTYLKGIEYARRVGFPTYAAWLAGELGLYVYIPLGELDKCEQTVLASLAVGQELGELYVLKTNIPLVFSSLYRGNLNKAESILREIVPIAERAQWSELLLGCYEAAGRLHFEKKDFPNALNPLMKAEKILVQGIDHGLFLQTMFVKLQIYLEAQQLSKAEETYQQVRQLATAIDEPWSTAFYHWARGIMAASCQKMTESIEALKKAAQTFHKVGRKYELAKVLLNLSQTLRSLNRENEAKQALAEAERIFTEMDAKRDLEKLSEFRKG